MNESQFATLPKPMQEAVTFCEYWNAASNLDEFLEVMGRPINPENKLWASQRAIMFRKKDVALKKMRGGEDADDYLDYSVLQVIAQRALAELGHKKLEADTIAHDIIAARDEALKIVSELRKFKDKAVLYELSKLDK